MPPVVRENTTSAGWRLLDLSYPTASENLALEEALARSSLSITFQPTVRLWVNAPSVIIGRFQDAYAEVDLDVCRQSGIQIARRFTGGGAVFHDEGNLNFTVVRKRPEGISLNELYALNASVVLELLSRLGLKANFEPLNTILVSGKKISGAAAALGHDFAFWHASILISTDTKLLNRVLSPGRLSVTRFIRSRWQPVTTVTELTGRPVDVEDVKRQLVKSFERVYEARLEAGGLQKEEELGMSLLHRQKYSSSEWNLNHKLTRGAGCRKSLGTHTTIAV